MDLGLRALMRGHHCVGWYLRKSTCGLILGVRKVTGHWNHLPKLAGVVGSSGWWGGGGVGKGEVGRRCFTGEVFKGTLF